MGTMIAMLLVLSALAGCANESMVNVRNAALPAQEEPAVTWVVELETVADTVSNEKGQEIAAYSYTVPALYAVLPDGSRLEEAQTEEEARYLEIMAAFDEPFSAWIGEAGKQDEFTGMAKEYWMETLHGSPFTDELTCTVYQTAHLVSISGTYYSWAGGAHPNTSLYSWNFDLDTGSFFDPQLLEEGSGLGAAVHAELSRQARERAAEAGMKPEDFFWSNYDDILQEWSNYAVSFDESGMTVAFSPYELACYAAGEQIFRIPYDWLAPRLSPAAQSFLGIGQ